MNDFLIVRKYKINKKLKWKQPSLKALKIKKSNSKNEEADEMLTEIRLLSCIKTSL